MYVCILCIHLKWHMMHAQGEHNPCDCLAYCIENVLYLINAILIKRQDICMETTI